MPSGSAGVIGEGLLHTTVTILLGGRILKFTHLEMPTTCLPAGDFLILLQFLLHTTPLPALPVYTTTYLLSVGVICATGKCLMPVEIGRKKFW